MAIEPILLAKAGEGFIKDIYGTMKDAASKKWQTFNWYTAQGDYFRKIERDYGTTRILGKPKPVSLEGIFTDVYLIDEPTAYLKFNTKHFDKEKFSIIDKRNRLSGLELVKEGKHHRLYILGKPGAGKTTFLKYIALKSAQQKIRKIPIFISLKEWADSNLDLMEFLVKQFDICRFPESQLLIEYLLEMGMAIVLFDGLDETQQEGGKRDKIIDSIRDFSRKYDNSQIIVTCRIAATDYTFDEFSYLEMADFTNKQVDIYVKNWFIDDKEKLKRFEFEFNQDDNKSLREMANTPLLLSLLCLNFERTGYFPQRRVEIYEEGISALLTGWDAKRNIKRDTIYQGLELGRKRQMFARIAVQTFGNNEYFLDKNRLTNLIIDYLSQLPDSLPKVDIDGEAVLKAIEAQHSIFIERAQGLYSFSHLTFQEYFTAKYIVEVNQESTFKELLSSENIARDRWREVILNTASLLNNADTFLYIFFGKIRQIIEKDKQLRDFISYIDEKAKPYKSSSVKLMVRGLLAFVELAFSIDSRISFSESLRTLKPLLDLLNKIGWYTTYSTLPTGQTSIYQIKDWESAYKEGLVTEQLIPYYEKIKEKNLNDILDKDLLIQKNLAHIYLDFWQEIDSVDFYPISLLKKKSYPISFMIKTANSVLSCNNFFLLIKISLMLRNSNF